MLKVYKALHNVRDNIRLEMNMYLRNFLDLRVTAVGSTDVKECTAVIKQIINNKYNMFLYILSLCRISDLYFL